jgi:DNA-binding transcriptional LysR family regulator
MNISSAKAFLAVVSKKSISKAAETLYLTQSTVSFQLKTLEDELGVMLIERGKGLRQINLTAKGQEFISIAERFVQVWNEAHALQYENTTSLTITSVDSINIYTLVSFYQQLLQGIPPVRLKIFTYNTPEIFERVDNHLADIGFVLSRRRYTNIIMRPILQEKMFYVQAKKRPEKEAITAIHPANMDFRKETLFDWGPEFRQLHNNWCNPNIHPNMQVDTITMLMYFLKDDHWTILPEKVIATLQKKYPLFSCPIEEGPPDRVCYKLVHRFPTLAQQAGIVFFEKRLDEFLQKDAFI